jgi:N-acetylmuramoyl-L-alanine amidase
LGEIHCQTIQLNNPNRLVVDIASPEAITESNKTKLQELNSQISSNDLFLKAIRVGVFKPGVIRMVIDLKADVKQLVRNIKPKTGNGNQLVLDVYSVNADKPAI